MQTGEQMMTKEMGVGWGGVGFLRVSSATCLTKPTLPPFELWLLFLPANTFSSLPPSVRANSTDTHCFQLSNSWQSVHHTLKWHQSGKGGGERWTIGQKQLQEGQIKKIKFKQGFKKTPESTEMLQREHFCRSH